MENLKNVDWKQLGKEGTAIGLGLVNLAEKLTKMKIRKDTTEERTVIENENAKTAIEGIKAVFDVALEPWLLYEGVKNK